MVTLGFFNRLRGVSIEVSIMGTSIYRKKEKALEKWVTYLRSIREEQAYIDTVMGIGSKAIDFYILEGTTSRRCKARNCINIISSQNQSGYCRKCYMKKYRKKPGQHKKSAIRAKKYRIKKKIRTLNGEN